jgi:peptidyl-prolyl cis-trans isomerase SurA
MRGLWKRTVEIAVVAVFSVFSVGGFTSSEESTAAPPGGVAPIVLPLPKTAENTPASSPTMVALDTVLALVNGEAITLADLERQSNPVIEYYRKMAGSDLLLRDKERILKIQLESLIDKTLILMEARDLGAKVEESRVREAISQLREVKMAFDGDLAKYLVATGMTYRQLYEEIEEQLLFNGMVQAKVLPKIRVSPSEIEQYYQRNIRRFTEEAAIHCFAITFMKRDNPEAAAQVLTRAREALQKLKDGVAFQDVAKEYSEDPAHADKGGDWGWIVPGSMEKKASDAAFALKEGEYSGIIEGDAAQWILLVTEKRDKSVVPLSAASKEIELALKTLKREIEIQRWGQRLRQNAAITYPVSIGRVLGK